MKKISLLRAEVKLESIQKEHILEQEEIDRFITLGLDSKRVD